MAIFLGVQTERKYWDIDRAEYCTVPKYLKYSS